MLADLTPDLRKGSGSVRLMGAEGDLGRRIQVEWSVEALGIGVLLAAPNHT